MECVRAGRRDAADPSDNLVENPRVAHCRQRRLDALLERDRLRASVDRRGRGTDAISCLDPAIGIVSSGSGGGGDRHVPILDDGSSGDGATVVPYRHVPPLSRDCRPAITMPVPELPKTVSPTHESPPL